jgi:hypothetical protein
VVIQDARIDVHDLIEHRCSEIPIWSWIAGYCAQR